MSPLAPRVDFHQLLTERPHYKSNATCPGRPFSRKFYWVESGISAGSPRTAGQACFHASSRQPYLSAYLIGGQALAKGRRIPQAGHLVITAHRVCLFVARRQYVFSSLALLRR
jgi:hypothetical protein